MSCRVSDALTDERSRKSKERATIRGRCIFRFDHAGLIARNKGSGRESSKCVSKGAEGDAKQKEKQHEPELKRFANNGSGQRLLLRKDLRLHASSSGAWADLDKVPVAKRGDSCGGELAEGLQWFTE